MFNRLISLLTLVFLFQTAIGQTPQQIINLGGSGNSERLSSMTTDANGNLYLLHLCDGNLMMGSTVIPSTLTNNFRTFVTKLDINKQLVWTKELNYYAPSETEGKRMAIDAAGNVYVTDQYFGTFNAGAFTLNGSGYRNFTYKLDPNGNLLWAVQGGGKVINITSTGTVELIQYNHLSGQVNGTPLTNPRGTVVWLDPANGSYLDHFQYDTPGFGTEVILDRNAAGNFHGFSRVLSPNQATANSPFRLLEIDENGTLLQSNLIFYGHNMVEPALMVQDPATGDYYLPVQFHDRTPLSASTPSAPLRTGILRVDQNLQVIGKLYLSGSNLGNTVDKMYLSVINGDLFFSVRLHTTGISISNNVAYLGQQNYIYPVDDKLYIAKLSNDLQVKWHREIPGLYYTNSIDPAILHNNKVLFAGTQTDFTMDGTIFNPNGSVDVFLLDVFDTDTTDIRITGSVFNDTDENGIYDAGESGLPYRQITSSELGSDLYFTRPDGSFDISGVAGEQVLHYNDLLLYWTHSNADSIVVEALTPDTIVEHVDFGAHPIAGITDLTASIFPLTAARPGFDATYQVEICNQGTEPSSGTFYVHQSPHLDFISATMTPDSIHADTLFFSYTNLLPLACIELQITDSVHNAPILGFNLYQQVLVTPELADSVETNNQDLLLHRVTGSYDPNDISVFPSCGVTENFVANGGTLEYLIRFQNTGSDTAFTVMIHDNISNLLDLSTFEIKGSSHHVEASISNRMLKLVYNNILLTDSTTNEPGSKGWFRYTIRPMATVVTGNQIPNTAAIFFDYNVPVITNTATTLIADEASLANVIPFSHSCSSNGSGSLHYTAFCNTSGHWVSVNNEPFVFNETGFIEGLEAGNYTLAVSNLTDTIHLATVTINYVPVAINLSETICPGDSLFTGGAWQQTSGIYTNLLHSASGCDTLITTTLNLHSGLTSNTTQAICQGDSLFVGGAWQHTAGVYTDALQSAYGCDSTVITTLSLHAPLISNLSETICQGDSLFAGGAWQHTAGIYTDLLQSTNGCDSTVITTLVLQTSPDLTVSVNNNVLTAPSQTPGVNYQWVDCQNNYAPIVGETGTTFSPEANGIYALMATYNGCSEFSECLTISTLGLSENELSGISVFPNPFGNSITVQFTNSAVRTIVLTDVSGKVILEEKYNGKENYIIPAELLGSGIYFLQVIENGGTFIEKMIK